MENDEVLDADEKKLTEAPGFLKTLCILTWIGSGLTSFLFLFLIVAFSVFAEMLADLPGFASLVNGGLVFLSILLLTTVGKIVGAVQMWMLKKRGFYIYTICEVVAFIVVVIINMGLSSETTSTGEENFPVRGLLFSGAFIAMYAANFKHMR